MLALPVRGSIVCLYLFSHILLRCSSVIFIFVLLMPPSILITNVCLPKKEGSSCSPANGWLAINGDTITSLGTVDQSLPPQAEQVIDAHGMLALPGLINTHCHAAMTLFRGLADDLELGEWLNTHIFPAEAANVSPEMVYWCSKLAAAEMIMSGTTTVADGYFFEDNAARAFADAGMRAVAAQAVIDFPAPGVPDPSGNIAAAATFVAKWTDKHPLITPAIFAHSPYTCSNATLQAAKKAARKAGVLFFIHLAESQAEMGMIAEPQGCTPLKHLAALGVLDRQTVCVHCVWIDDEDPEILARHKANIVLCPQSHLKLASGIAPAQAMLQYDIPVGLGTDGAASNNSLDMFREMDICAKVQKIKTLDPVAVPARKILSMATTTGSEVLGMEQHIGRLAPGMKADIILINSNMPHLQPMHSTDLLVYAANGADVDTVIINGTPVMQNKKLLGFDLPETLRQVRLLAEKLNCKRK
jgi:5-methylthioadenosine/S-adenosylhomocysteine deaminase